LSGDAPSITVDLTALLHVDFRRCSGVTGVSFQITVLKVLAGSPGGRVPLADLRRDVAILISSGRDWTDRTKRIAARAPDLNIFSQALVTRDAAGWQIAHAGLEFLARIEKPASVVVPAVEPEVAFVPPAAAPPPVPLIGINSGRRGRRGRRRLRARSSASGGATLAATVECLAAKSVC
jgi:hypothetical protein